MRTKNCNFLYIFNIFALLLTVSTLINYSVCASYDTIITDNDIIVNNDEEFIVVIDPGHGGIDPGAVGADGTLEKDLNLTIASYISEYLANKGIKTVLTRQIDEMLTIKDSRLSKKTQDLKARVQIANAHLNGIFVSIHMNKFTDDSVHGLQVWYSSNGRLSQILADSIQSSVTKTIQPNNKREIKKDSGSIYVLRNSRIPAALVECGFLSNQEELSLLKNSDYQQKLSKSIADGILNYLGEKNVG